MFGYKISVVLLPWIKDDKIKRFLLKKMDWKLTIKRWHHVYMKKQRWSALLTFQNWEIRCSVTDWTTNNGLDNRQRNLRPALTECIENQIEFNNCLLNSWCSDFTEKTAHLPNVFCNIQPFCVAAKNKLLIILFFHGLAQLERTC